MTPDGPHSTNRFVKKSSVRPAIEVDCSTWDADTPCPPQTTGRLVKSSSVRPAVEVDCSGWPEGPAVRLELTLHPHASADSVQLALGLFDVLNAVNNLDRALGGMGLTKVVGQQTNGTVTLVLAAEEPTGASDRIRQICDRINQATQPADSLSLPSIMKTIEARVA